MVTSPVDVVIKGVDDSGLYYENLNHLHSVQEANKLDWYHQNAVWWETGYGGTNDDEAMIGDSDGERDALAGLSFLDEMLRLNSNSNIRCALDCGAGVGRITKYVLLRRCSGTVTLVEGNRGWSLRSRVYLGRKRAANCEFLNENLLQFNSSFYTKTYDLIWVQWCLQYFTDLDAVEILRNLSKCLSSKGLLIMKENIPTCATTGACEVSSEWVSYAISLCLALAVKLFLCSHNFLVFFCALFRVY